jgi:hypothetical protein
MWLKSDISTILSKVDDMLTVKEEIEHLIKKSKNMQMKYCI